MAKEVSKPKEPKEQVPKKKATVSVLLKNNQKFDLHIGRNMVTFLGRERKEIPVEWLHHRDWQNVKQYFIVKGV